MQQFYQTLENVVISSIIVIIPKIMAEVLERQAYPYTHPENVPFITEILWERGSNFEPNIVNETLGEESRPVSNETFGEGHRWYLGFIGGMRTRLDFYSQSRVMFLTFNDSKDVSQERMYIIDSIGLGSVGERDGVAFLSERDMKSEIVLVQTNGNFDEFHHRLTLIKQDLPVPIVEEETEAEIKTEDDLKSLFRRITKSKRNPGLKEEVMLLITNAFRKVDQKSLDGDELLSYNYLTLRFVRGLSTEEVARELGYTREHATRIARKAAIDLLLKLLKR